MFKKICNKIKKFFTNKNGDFTIVGIIILPTLVIAATIFIFSSMQDTVAYKKIKTSIDNVLYYGANKYGSIKTDKNFEKFCDMNPVAIIGGSEVQTRTKASNVESSISVENQSYFIWYFDNYIKHIDGYNELWSYSLSVKKNNEINSNGTLFDPSKSAYNEYLIATVTVVLPDINIDDEKGFGTAVGNNQALWTGWYKDNAAKWIEYKNYYVANGNEKGKLTGLTVFEKNDAIEVYTTCY